MGILPMYFTATTHGQDAHATIYRYMQPLFTRLGIQLNAEERT